MLPKYIYLGTADTALTKFTGGIEGAFAIFARTYALQYAMCEFSGPCRAACADYDMWTLEMFSGKKTNCDR